MSLALVPLRATDAAREARADRGAIARLTRRHYHDGTRLAASPCFTRGDAGEARRRARAARNRRTFWPKQGHAAVIEAANLRADRAYWLGLARGLRGKA